MKERCLVILKMYGIRPSKLRIISEKNSGTRREENPFRKKELVRLNCSHINFIGIRFA